MKWKSTQKGRTSNIRQGKGKATQKGRTLQKNVVCISGSGGVAFSSQRNYVNGNMFRVDTVKKICDFYRTQVSLVRSMGPVVTTYVQDLFEDLTDVTLVDEDTNSIPTNNTNRTIQDNVAMPVTNPGDQIWN